MIGGYGAKKLSEMLGVNVTLTSLDMKREKGVKRKELYNMVND